MRDPHSKNKIKVCHVAQSYKIENAAFCLEVSSLGAEMKSLVVKDWQRDILWNPKSEAERKIWSRTSPILFPIVGKLKDEHYVLKDKIYQMSQHGFARDREFTCIKVQQDKIVFFLEANQETFAQYPFCFELTVSYELIDKTLQINYAVKNVDRQEIYFSIGAHPAFATSVLSDHEIHFEKKERGFFQLKEGLVDWQKLTALSAETILPTKELFYKDALIFKDLKSKYIELVNRHSHEVIRISGTNTPYLGIWGKGDVPFICIEPWYGVSDAADHDGNLENKIGIQTLAEGGTFRFTFSISFQETFGEAVR